MKHWNRCEPPATLGYLKTLSDWDWNGAIAEILKARDSEPLSPIVSSEVSIFYIYDGQLEEAMGIHQTRIVAYGDSVGAEAYGNLVLPALGLHGEARSFYEFALETSKTSYVMPGILGMLAASIGDTDAAFAHFDQAQDERSMVMSWLRDPLIANIRDDPRYAVLFERVGLTP